VIEQAMIFALGFLVAGLLSLLFVPVLSRRALRLAMARLRMLVPLSPAEIVAERDQIRAEHAVATRRLEQKLEGLAQANAELMIREGRLGTRLTRLEQEHAAALAHSEALTSDLARTTREAHEAQAELGLQMQLLHDTLGLAERRLAILRSTEARLAAIEAQADERRATIAALETRSTGQDLRIRGLLTQVGSALEDLKSARDTADTLSSERDAARADVALLTRKRDELLAERDRLLRVLEAAMAPAGDRPASAQELRAAITQLTDDLLRFVASQPLASGTDQPGKPSLEMSDVPAGTGMKAEAGVPAEQTASV
jgi:chromosome segregation ATPase